MRYKLPPVSRAGYHTFSCGHELTFGSSEGKRWMNNPLEKSVPTQAEYFKEIVGTIREPLLVLDASLRVLDANRSFYKFFKVKAGETIGCLVYDLGDRQWDIPGLRLLLETILPEKAVFNDFNMEHDFPVIGWRILLLNARRISMPPNAASRILLAFEDVTERVEMERKLQASEKQFHAVFETASDSMLLVDKISGQVRNSNRVAQDSLGYSKRALQKKNLWELGILEDRQQFRQISIELEKQGVVGLVETTIPTSQGGDYPADITIMDRSEVIQCNIRDVTERKKAEDELILANKELVYQNEEKEKRAAELILANKELVYQNEEKEKRAAELILTNKELAYQKEEIRKLNSDLERTVEKRTAQIQETVELNQKMIEASSLGIFACRADGPCSIANPAIARISGAPVEKMLQLNFRELESWKENGLFDLAEAALATGKEQRAENHLTTPFGREAWLNYYFTTFTSNGALHFLMMVEDITERKQADQVLQQRTAELETANKELESFSYSVSHDLRSPLRAIDGFSRILIEEYASQLPAEARRYLDLVRSNTQKMGELVDDLLAFSRLGRQPLKKQTVSPEAIVRKALEGLRTEQAGRQFEIVIGDPSARPGHALPDCEADPALLKQVFINLLSNAFKFTRKRPLARIEVGFEEKDGMQAYFVRDNGVGFDMQYVGKLFSVFQRLHRSEDYEGTGVGLAIVQRIVTRHGGRAWAKAQVDKGATFYFTLEGGESNDSD
jgi:PAS domain S-box-containing protein